MRLTIAESAESAARLAADELERVCVEAIHARGRAVIAVSGGTTPWVILRDFATRSLPWDAVIVAQVDERCVPLADERRNLAPLERLLVQDGRLPPSNLLAMPVDAEDLNVAAHDYAATLARVAGTPPVLDLVQLGLGADGHTASLVPGDAALEVVDRDVATTGLYQATRRMTLTLPVLNRARERLWLVTGATKASALLDLLDGSGCAPASRVRREETLVLADRAATATGAR